MPADRSLRAALSRLGRQHLWPFAVVLAAPFMLFARFLLGWDVLYWGTPLLQFYPWRLAALAALRGGEWPLWNPAVGNGAPLLANYQAGVLYPPNWLALLVPLDLSLSWLAAFHLALAGAGMVVLARSLGFSPLAQAVAGLAFGLSQYLVARVGFLSINAAVAWLPWLVWAVDWLARRPAASAPRDRLLAALALSAITALLLLAGHAQTAWYSLLIAGAWSLWRLPAHPGWRARLAVLAWLAAPLLLGAGLAAAQLLPTAELMQASPRAVSADVDFVMTYSFSPWRLGTLLAPDLLGNPARGRFYGYGNYWEDAVYAGVLPLLLAVGALAGALVRLRRADSHAGLPLFLGGLAIVSIVLGLGRNTPVFPFFYDHVPTFNLFQAPARLLLGLVFALPLLAGLGVSRWQPPRGRALYWTRLGTAGAAGVLALGWAAAFFVTGEGPLAAQLRVVGAALGLAGAALLVAGALSLLRSRLPARVWTAAVVLFVAADLLYAGAGLNPAATHTLYDFTPASARDLAPALAGRRLFYYPAEEHHVKFKRLMSFETFGPASLAYCAREALLPNTAVLDGLSSANNFDPLVSARYAALLNLVEATQSLSLLRLLNVGVLASTQTRSLPLLSESQAVGVYFYAVPGPTARAWVVHQARFARDGAEALALLADPLFDPATTVVLEAPGPASAAATRADLGPEPLSLTETANTVTLRGTLLEPGWVLLADTHYPGWVALLDGQPVPILPANHALRAVAVPAGEHTLAFHYRPLSFALGLRLSLLSALAWLLAALLAWRTRRRPGYV